MVPASFWIPIGLFAALALVAYIAGGRIRKLLAVLVMSYCGVMAVTFTRGASGGVWPTQILLLLFAAWVTTRPAMPAFGSAAPSRLTIAVFAVYVAGVLVGLARFDPSLEAVKAGAYRGLSGIPLPMLMAGYRLMTIATLALAFAMPQRHLINRKDFTRILLVGWLMSLGLAGAQFVDYSGFARLGFRMLVEEESAHQSDLLGFNRGSVGMLFVFATLQGYALARLHPNRLLKSFVWLSAPFLVTALLLTWSRAATMAMAVASVSLIVTLGGRRAVWGVVLSLFGIGVVYFVLSHYADVTERYEFFMTGRSDESIQARLVTWGDILTYLFRQPDVLVFGAGFQNFHYSMHVGQGVVMLDAAHNNYLHILAETGVIGFSLFVAWLVSIFVWLRRWRRREHDPMVSTLSGVFASMMIACVVAAITQESLAPAHAMVGWLLHFYLVLGTWVSWYRGEAWNLRQRTAATQTVQALRAVQQTRGAAGDLPGIAWPV